MLGDPPLEITSRPGKGLAGRLDQGGPGAEPGAGC